MFVPSPSHFNGLHRARKAGGCRCFQKHTQKTDKTATNSLPLLSEQEKEAWRQLCCGAPPQKYTHTCTLFSFPLSQSHTPPVLLCRKERQARRGGEGSAEARGWVGGWGWRRGIYIHTQEYLFPLSLSCLVIVFRTYFYMCVPCQSILHCPLAKSCCSSLLSLSPLPCFDHSTLPT